MLGIIKRQGKRGICYEAWEDERQCYIRAAMEQNTPEENEVLKKRLEEIDWSVFEHVDRKETVNERGVFAPLEAVELAEFLRENRSFVRSD